MQGTKIPFGERDDVLLRAFEVANGLACNCICPGCRKPLVAANGGLKVIPHFRHAQAEDCSRGYKEGVRRAAVALIATQQRLTLPAYYHQISNITDSGHTLRCDVAFPSEVIIADNVARFVDFEEVRAHAVVSKADRQLLVWVKVSSRTQHERHQRLASIGASAIEIDLSRLTLEQINDSATFEYAVLSNPDNRSWIRSLRGERLGERAAEKMAVEVATDNARWEHERARNRTLEEARRGEHEAKFVAAAKALVAQRKLQSAAVEAQRAMNQDACLQRSALIVSQVLRAAREWGATLSNAPHVTYLAHQIHNPTPTVQVAPARCPLLRYHLSMQPPSTIECAAHPNRTGQFKQHHSCEPSLSSRMSSVDHLVT